MMTYMKIKCGGCGWEWTICEGENFNDDEKRFCPCCKSGIDKQTWENQVLPGFLQMADANRELLRDHSGYGHAHFKVSIGSRWVSFE